MIFPETIIRRHLGNDSFGSVIKSTLFGIPLPLCSCGVVPVAASLRNSGASRGASISFLISTPQVGADSFMITYSLLGWIFGLFRIAASIITALAAGIMVNILAVKERPPATGILLPVANQETYKQRLKTFFSYVEYELLGSIAGTLIIGILLAGLIAAVIPDGFFERRLDHPFFSMIIMLVIGIPMYVCAAASTPIAASLIMKGLSPGAALVFLLCGPATNMITITTVSKTLGKTSTIVYLASISIVSLALGYLLNLVTATYGFQKIIMLHGHDMLPNWLKLLGSCALALMLGWYYVKTKLLTKTDKGKTMSDTRTRIPVKGMTCQHCAGNVKKAVEAVTGASDAEVNLDDGYVEFETTIDYDIEQVKAAIISAGYTV